MTNRVIWQIILVYIINLNMNETIVGLDRIFEFTANNLRRWLQDFLRIRKETSERVIGVLCLSWDIYQQWFSDDNFLYFVYLWGFISLETKNNSYRLADGPKITSRIIDIIIPSCSRLICALLFSTQICYWEIYLIPLFIYIATEFYDDDDQWIRKWTKWKLDSLKKSIQPA
jgi:hypothetical protein